VAAGAVMAAVLAVITIGLATQTDLLAFAVNVGIDRVRELTVAGVGGLIVNLFGEQTFDAGARRGPVGFAVAGGALLLTIGAGFASLRHVLELKPDYVKLDMSLTQSIDHDPRKRALARGLIGIVTELGIEIVAEGIETPAQLATLRELGVGLGQGFLLGTPLPLAR